MDKLYKTKSSNEHGTLYQLRNLIERRNVVTTVSKDYHAVSAFFDLAVECHVVAAAMQVLEMEDIDAKPACLPRRMEIVDKHKKSQILHSIAALIIDRFIFNKMTAVLEGMTDDDIQLPEEPVPQNEPDHVLNYASAVMKYGLLRRVALMSTKSGDGERALRHWKFAIPLYHEAHKTKYRLEGFLLIASVKALLPARLSKQVLCSRFVNLTGGEGNNLDGDYVLELQNNLAKSKIKTLGPNHTPEMVMRIGKTMMFSHEVTRCLGSQLGVAPISRTHTSQETTRDKHLIIEELHLIAKVFHYIPGREHATFSQQPDDIYSAIKVPELHKWLHEKKDEYAGTKWAF